MTQVSALRRFDVRRYGIRWHVPPSVAPLIEPILWTERVNNGVSCKRQCNMALTDKEQLVEINALIEAHKSTILATRRTLERPEITERLIIESRDAISRLERNIAQLLDAQQNGPALIERSHLRILQLVEQRKLVANRAAIEKLLEMQTNLARMEHQEFDLSDAVVEAEGLIEPEPDAESSDDEFSDGQDDEQGVAPTADQLSAIERWEK